MIWRDETPYTYEEEAQNERYLAAAHGMQTGVMYKQTYDLKDSMQEGLSQSEGYEREMKHIRVGTNNALVEHGALISLLVEKGLLTRLEYLKRLADFMENERDLYAKMLSDLIGKDITLG